MRGLLTWSAGALLCLPLHAQDGAKDLAPVAPPSQVDPDVEAIIAKPRSKYESELDALKEKYRKAVDPVLKAATAKGDLDAVKSIQAEIESPKAIETSWDNPKMKMAARAYQAEAEKARKAYAASLESSIRDLVKKGNIDLAEKVKAAIPIPGALMSELVVEAFVDGSTKLHITPAGLYWTSHGVAKVGRLDSKNEPTFVNGVSWMPAWEKPKEDRGNDKSALFPIQIGQLGFDLEVKNISEERKKQAMDRRDPVTIKSEDGEQIVSIPDQQAGGRWYTLRLFRK